MTCWYELRGADNRLVELRRGFASEIEAWEAACRALAKIKIVAPMAETLEIVTGTDGEATKAAATHRPRPKLSCIGENYAQFTSREPGERHTQMRRVLSLR